MSTAISTTSKLLTAAEFLRLPDTERPKELVKGKVVYMNVPYPRHGHYCSEVGFLLKSFVKPRDLGWVLTNDSGVITEHDPDTGRGPDVVYFSYQRGPKGTLPDDYVEAAPELVVEIRSAETRWKLLHKKVGEYLDAGVINVCVVDPGEKTVHIFSADQPVRVLRETDEWTLPEVLPGFSTPLAKLFVA
jgi:Uma2 family endonuclease